jgi:hypothetical protein
MIPGMLAWQERADEIPPFIQESARIINLVVPTRKNRMMGDPRVQIENSGLSLTYQGGKALLAFFLPLVLLVFAQSLYAQEPNSPPAPTTPSQSTQVASPAPQTPQKCTPPAQTSASGTASDEKQSDGKSACQNSAPADQGTSPEKVQPKRILGVMPNFRAVSAGALPPPPSPMQAFIIATQNSFDYSAFIFVGITSLLAEGTDAHPQLGKGLGGFGGYYWRGFVDKTDGNYLVLFALPTVFHQDERYYAMGKGGIWKRGFYAASRIFITPDYNGHNSFNISELLGRGISQGVSLAYYPSRTRTAGAIGAKFGYALGRDALTNVFREFWPDIAVHVLHRHP